ncbi:hypothetical protein O181_006493 [Austropuccinia psidii MF-1]|uniref:Uncharacterized protein n=1 Tax=Austropuccinia psidii MF-1 TaxID=1389203 RepID=A0A9Q3GGM6_9BASI|nr:hypothetical protein [Austropuccinia psidii MF-1]
MQANKQEEIFQHFISLVEKIRPQLRADAANFNLWSRNMIVAWKIYFMGDTYYFEQMNIDCNVKRNLVSQLFIEHRINHSAYKSVTSQIFISDVCQIYRALNDWFNCPSWYSVVHHANIIFETLLHHSNNINNYAMSVTEDVQNLENQLGQIYSEIITTLAVYFSVPSIHQLIIPAINNLMETNPNTKAQTYDLLNMIRKIATALPSFHNSTEFVRINASLRFGKK